MKKNAIDPVELFIQLKIKGDYNFAVATLKKILEKDPKNIEVLFQLANVHSVMGKRPAKAQQILEQVLKADSKHYSAHANLGTCLMQQRKYHQAIKHYTISMRGGVTAETLKQRALCYEKIKNFKLSLRDLRKCIELLSDYTC